MKQGRPPAHGAAICRGAPAGRLHWLAVSLVLALAAVVALPARAGDDAPRLPCGAAPLPAFAEPGQPPAVLAWSGKPAREWVPPGCTGWTTSGFDVLVAVAGSFKHDGEIDGLLLRIGAISAKSGVRYWSTTDKAWSPLVTEAFALSGPESVLRRPDFSAANFVKGQSLYFAQSDNRTAGKTVFRDQVLVSDRERVVIASENLTPVKKMMVTIFEPGDLQAVYFVERRSPGVWSFYSLTRTRMASRLMPHGSDASYINRAVAYYRLVAGIPTDLEPPAAR